MSYDIDVLHADKHESPLQVDTISFDGVGQASPSTQDLQCLCDILKDNCREKKQTVLSDLLVIYTNKKRKNTKYISGNFFFVAFVVFEL